MKKIALICGALLCISTILSSCGSDEPSLQSVTGQKEEPINPLKIPADEAVEIAFKAVGDISRDTRASRTVSSVELLKGRKTRGGNDAVPDSALYLINFNDDRGFALVAADRRLRPFYAVSDEGNLNLSDTVENKGLALVLNNIYAETDCLTDTLPTVGGFGGWNGHTPGLLPDKPITSGFVRDVYVAPMLNEGVRTGWRQTYPFNRYCFTSYGKKAQVGCAAIATAMVMSCFEWPKQVEDRNLNWSMMKTYDGSDDLYYLLAKLGENGNLNMNYGESSSGAYKERYPITYQNFGYEKPDEMSDFSLEYALSSLLSNDSPLMARGELYNRTSGTLEGGHAWIIDGVIGYDSDGTVTRPGGNTKSRYFHCVWGWNGSANGYFAILSRQIDQTYEQDSESPLAYKVKGIQIMGNFKPKKN